MNINIDALTNIISCSTIFKSLTRLCSAAALLKSRNDNLATACVRIKVTVSPGERRRPRLPLRHMTYNGRMWNLKLETELHEWRNAGKVVNLNSYLVLCCMDHDCASINTIKVLRNLAASCKLHN